VWQTRFKNKKKLCRTTPVATGAVTLSRMGRAAIDKLFAALRHREPVPDSVHINLLT
jgi:hypothetical protein